MQIHTAPPNSGTVVLGRTLPSLLDEACAETPNETAFSRHRDGAWESISNSEFRTRVDEAAAGFLEAGLDRGDRVAMVMHSDTDFVEVDLASLLAGLINVPLYLTGGREVKRYAISHSGSRALVVSDAEILRELAGCLAQCPQVRLVVMADRPNPGETFDLPEGVQLVTLADVRRIGRARIDADPDLPTELRARLHPNDSATIIYTSGTTGQPKGVVLSHENMSFNGPTAFTGLQVGRGKEERAASFLPMSHIFGRVMTYGCLQLGFSIYFIRPEQIGALFPEIRPTIFGTVPRTLEKTYDRIMLRRHDLSGVKLRIFDWSMELARRYDVARKPSLWMGAQLAVADRLVYSKWKAALGGEVRWIIVGGAALHADLTNIFSAAGLHVLQGYGLTETSPVITYNRVQYNRAGSVGLPMAGVEVTLGDDGEILTRGPHVMKAYYADEEATAQVMDADGWFHTGDIGAFTEEGYLTITDRKKDLFKLSTGKYVVPQPIENTLMAEPLVDQAVVVGPGYKFCTALIFVNEEALRKQLTSSGISDDAPLDHLCKDDRVVGIYQRLVDRANVGMSHWETVKRFTLVPEAMTIEGGFLTPTLKVKRSRVLEAYRDRIEAAYADAPDLMGG